ncbi:hypothetical protein [Flammeovirga pacifica]|uniref:Uncharacterized protein n=1 Tax=Flammeovirga pacifica TaxID=915059 RepID=A0A1S1YW00_FLAPC|nr:hypothetical protein [Flammeovirga pacifica]OHX64985.1 hypothetical protein NH26_00785 [Flammeovirga pacifica]
MNKLTTITVLFTLLVGCFSCHNKIEDLKVSSAEVEDSNKRMPFNQKVFILNSAGNNSTIYQVEYDFQGLIGNAKLTKLNTSEALPKGGHMCVSPDNRFLTVVVARQNKIFLVEINTGEVRSATLMAYNPNKVSIETVKSNPSSYLISNLKNSKGRKIGGITQVDIDQDGYLFIAGKAGFFRVVADRGNGIQDPRNVGYKKDIWSEIWEQQDEDYLKKNNIDTDKYGTNWVHAIHYSFAGGVSVESSEDGEENYFELDQKFNPKKVRFKGGDILFTQNSKETDGFESQRLISFSQWKGGTAIYLDLHWDYENEQISFNAGKVFGGLNTPKNGEIGRNAGKVTGAALTGDNMVLTSHHKSEYLQLRTLDGEIIASNILMELSEGGTLFHNWGDMASTQAFDVNSENDDQLSNKEIDGEYYEDWYRGDFDGHQYAEIKLYRPGMGADQYDVLDLSDDNHNVSKESRRNSANADIADYSKNGSKFVSLGGNSGYAIFRLPQPVTVTSSTTLQVVETSWYKSSGYTTIEDAFKAYPEKATVKVLTNNTARYFSEKLLNETWTEVGKASIANNEYHLSDLEGSTIQWILIEDTDSKTPDGFDINFVSVFE